jgi:hypothetical protein
MALPPTMADSGPSAIPPAGTPPDDAGNQAPDDTAGEGDESGESEVIATICRTPDGKFILYAGDEPEDEPAEAGEGEPPAAEPQTFDSGPALLRGVMALIESDAGAEKSFGDSFAAKSKGAMPPAGGGM